MFFNVKFHKKKIIFGETARALVAHLATDKEPSWKGFFYMGVITFTSLCETILSSSSSKRSYLTAMRVKTVLSNAVFRKTLRISNASRKGITIITYSYYKSLNLTVETDMKLI